MFSNFFCFSYIEIGKYSYRIPKQTSCSDNGAPKADASAADAPKSDTSKADTSSKTCATLPQAATLDPLGTACTSQSGKWTMLTLTKETNTYFIQCDLGDVGLYADQADFDANEATSRAPGVTTTSNGDFVRTATCSSGSIQYTNAGTTTTIIFIWEKK